MRSFREIPLWKDVTAGQWEDWRWQLDNRITTLEQLQQILDLGEKEIQGLEQCCPPFFRLAITPYYASLMDPGKENCPLRQQGVPTILEQYGNHPSREDQVSPDPLQEEASSPMPGLVHRYPDRVLLLVTDQCAMYCRHCTRRRLIGAAEQARSAEQIQAAIDYIRQRPVIRDVLLSGGDPLLLEDDQLDGMLKQLRSIDHVEIIRIGTRMPAVMPQRINQKLCKILAGYAPLYLNLQFNHPREVTAPAAVACNLLANAGIPLGNQSVLLAGINDCAQVLKELSHQLLKIRVRPYYLYQCDPAPGIEHFRTKVAAGIKIVETLRGHTSGLGVPTFCIDAPGGGGKIPVMPPYLISQTPDRVVLRNYEGKIYTYPEAQQIQRSAGPQGDPLR